MNTNEPLEVKFGVPIKRNIIIACGYYCSYSGSDFQFISEVSLPKEDKLKGDQDDIKG